MRDIPMGSRKAISDINELLSYPRSTPCQVEQKHCREFNNNNRESVTFLPSETVEIST